VEVPSIPQIAALLVATVGAIADWRTRKVPNIITFPAAGLGVLTQAIFMGATSTLGWLPGVIAGTISGILGWITAVLVMSFFKLIMREFGHGDTKLMAAVGSFVGPGAVLIVWLYYSLSFGAFAIVRILSALPWHQAGLFAMTKQAGITDGTIDLSRLKTVLKERIPVAPFIAAGTLCYIFLGTPTLHFMGFK
jgi:prepilin peptidase CpaA